MTRLAVIELFSLLIVTNGSNVECKSYSLLTLQLGREVLDIAAQEIEVGVTTEEIDKLVHEVSNLHKNHNFNLQKNYRIRSNYGIQCDDPIL